MQRQGPHWLLPAAESGGHGQSHWVRPRLSPDQPEGTQEHGREVWPTGQGKTALVGRVGTGDLAKLGRWKSPSRSFPNLFHQLWAFLRKKSLGETGLPGRVGGRTERLKAD